MHRFTRVGFAVCLLLLSLTAFAQPPEPVLLQSWDGFSVSEFTIDDGYAWGLGGVYQDPELYRLDLTDEGDGEFVLDLPARCTALAAADGLLILTAGWEGLYLVDISEPLNPVWLSPFHMPGESQDVVIRDGIAYVACSYSGLVTVDVTTPSAPVITDYQRVGQLEDVVQLALHDNWLILAAENYGYVSYSLSDAAHPAPRDTLEAYHDYDVTLAKLSLSDHYFCQPYMSWADDGWDTYTGYFLHSGEMQNGYFDQLAVHEFGWTDRSGACSAALNDTTLIASMYSDLGIYDFTESLGLETRFLYPDSTLGYMLVLEGILYAQTDGALTAFALNGEATLETFPKGRNGERKTADHVFSASVPPSQVKTQNSGKFQLANDEITVQLVNSVVLDSSILAGAMMAKGDAIYIPEWSDTLLEEIHIYDISDPAHPTYDGTFPALTGENYDLAMTGDTMMVSVGFGVKLFDIADPVNPHYIGGVQLDAVLEKIVAHGDRLYGLEVEALYSFNISNPDNPVLLDRVKIGRRPFLAISPDGTWLQTAYTYSYSNRPFDAQAFGRAELYSLELTGDLLYKVKSWSIRDGENYSLRKVGFNNSQLQTSFRVSDGWDWSQSTSLVHDFSDPFYPVVILEDSRDNVPGADRAFWYDDYLIYAFNGLTVHGISDPANPELLLEEATVQAEHTALNWPFLYAINNYRLKVYNLDGALEPDPDEPGDPIDPGKATDFAIHSIYPNPFNPETTITIDMPEAGTAKVTVYDILGREVARLANRTFGAGRHALTFDASELPSGLYFARLDVDKFTSTRKMVLLK